MTAVGLIPARFAATRFPGKPLATIAGKSMIQRVYEGARAAKSLRSVIVATDDERIADACRAFGAEVAMTRSDHASGSDRIGEVAARLSDEIVVNIQGDEPLMEGYVVDAAVEALREDADVPIATVVHPLDPADRDDPNRVKVVLDQRGRALYFSRSAIPYPRDPAVRAPLWQHVGLYAYRRDFLLRFIKMAPTLAERSECLEQLRALENGHGIRCAIIEGGWRSVAVDVPGDVALVEAALRARS
ncbi:MAG TPA: 3-deoxy-manno-octulosonate cytidylyltransferase [Myxococcota bacterium]|jgi:3-deoxy-manno-octulosonate cytidylyltransferase (CMP-KDO synthetase)|nr:3-deoxy-manno-octulosonate cytidylyltransferase [Myxococcota bacterium]